MYFQSDDQAPVSKLALGPRVSGKKTKKSDSNKTGPDKKTALMANGRASDQPARTEINGRVYIQALNLRNQKLHTFQENT